MHKIDLALGAMIVGLLALMSIVIFGDRPEFRAAAFIVMVIGYPCLLGILIQCDPRVR